MKCFKNKQGHDQNPRKESDEGRETRKETGVVTRVRAGVGVEAVLIEGGVEVGIAVKEIEKGHHMSKLPLF